MSAPYRLTVIDPGRIEVRRARLVAMGHEVPGMDVATQIVRGGETP